MKRSKVLLLLLCLAGALAFNPKAYGQKVALKSNLAHWALMGSPNAGVEFALSPKWTLDVDGGLNLWKFRVVSQKVCKAECLFELQMYLFFSLCFP